MLLVKTQPVKSGELVNMPYSRMKTADPKLAATLPVNVQPVYVMPLYV